MRARFAAAVAIVCVVAVPVGGCGGGSDTSGAHDSSSAPSPAAKARFVKQAIALCQRERADTGEELEADRQRLSKDGLSGAALSLAAIRAVLLSTIADEIAALRKLEPPVGEEAEVRAIMVNLQSTLESARKVKGLTSHLLEARFGPVDKELRAYGLGACAKA